MTRRLQVSEHAKLDLLEIWEFISRDNLRAADRMVVKIESKYKLLARFPRMGQYRNDLGEGMRTFPEGNYLIVYRVIDDRVSIERVLHGARKIEDLFRGPM